MGLTSGAQGLPLRQASEKDLCKKDLRGMKSVGRFVDGAACRDTTQSRLPLR